MRAGLKPDILMIEGDFVGFDLSPGYCAEHECGIDGINKTLAVDPVDFHTECEDFSDIYFAESGGSEKMAILALLKDKQLYKKNGTLPEYGDHPKKFRSFRRELYSHGQIASAWSTDEFAILVKGKELVSEMKNLYAAILINDACVWLGGRGDNPFARNGLCIAISSRLPEEIKKAWRESSVNSEEQKKTPAAAKEKIGVF